ncbi:MAG: hypothetical protein IPH58_13835 [Sphingobacteriales bacterium]|jgi:hypothetical protein|nr:hypothetical protein [Sphingobacteriales bacterium]
MKIVLSVLIAFMVIIGLASCMGPYMAYHRPPLPLPSGIGIFPGKPYYKNHHHQRYNKQPRRYNSNRYYYDDYGRY